MQYESINFYEPLRAMENASQPFSVSWCTLSYAKNQGGNSHTENNVTFEGKRETEDYELMFFKRPDGSLISCHLYSLEFFNGQKMTIS